MIPKAVDYFWHATGFNKQKMTKAIWMYFDLLNYEMVIPVLKKSKLSLDEFLEQNLMGDLHAAIDGELISLLDEPPVVKNRLIIMNAVKYPQEITYAAAEGFKPETVDLYLKYWGFGNLTASEFETLQVYLQGPTTT